MTSSVMAMANTPSLNASSRVVPIGRDPTACHAPAVALPVDVQLMAPPTEVADRARALAATGVAGLFTFEGPNDVFIPLVLAAGVAPVDLMTNVAIAFPRSPVHLAHAAWDLQALSGRRFRLGLGSQVRAHVER